MPVPSSRSSSAAQTWLNFAAAQPPDVLCPWPAWHGGGCLDVLAARSVHCRHCRHAPVVCLCTETGRVGDFWLRWGGSSNRRAFADRRAHGCHVVAQPLCGTSPPEPCKHGGFAMLRLGYACAAAGDSILSLLLLLCGAAARGGCLGGVRPAHWQLHVGADWCSTDVQVWVAVGYCLQHAAAAGAARRERVGG